MGLSRQEYWSGLPFPSPGDLPDPGIEPRSSALQADPLPIELPGKIQAHFWFTPDWSMRKIFQRELSFSKIRFGEGVGGWVGGYGMEVSS